MAELGTADVPYRYLISYMTAGAGAPPVFGHAHLQRSAPFTSDALGDVMDYIQKDKGLPRPPVITSVFTFADSLDAPRR